MIVNLKVCLHVKNRIPVNGHPQIDRKLVFMTKLLLLNASQKYCRMLQGEHSKILLTFIKLPSIIKIYVLSIFQWTFFTGFTVLVSDSGVTKYRRYSRAITSENQGTGQDCCSGKNCEGVKGSYLFDHICLTACQI